MDQVVAELGIDAEVRAVQDISEILKHNIMMTPAIKINGEVVLVGRPPSKDEAKKWILDRK